MRILDKYITKEFLRYYFLFLLFFVAIFVLTDFFTSMGSLRKEASILQVIFYYILQIPYLLIILSPFSTIISSLFTISYFCSTNQLQAIQINRISAKRAVLPLFTAGLIISFSTFFLDNTIVYRVNQISFKIKQRNFTQISKAKVQRNIFVAIPPEYVLYIRELDLKKKIVNDVLIYKNSPPTLICAKEGRWTGDVWILYQGRNYILTDEPKGEFFKKKIIPITKKPEYFTRTYFPPERMNISELAHYIEEYTRSGFNTGEFETELQFKISSPFANFILMLLVIPLGIILGWRGKGASLALGLLISFGYYELTALFKTMGKTGVVEPFFAAWIANIVFIIAGAYLIYKME